MLENPKTLVEFSVDENPDKGAEIPAPAFPVDLLEASLLEPETDSESASDAVVRLRDWISGNRERLDIVEVATAERLSSNKVLTPQILELFGELEQERSVAFLSEKLAWCLETGIDFLPRAVEEYLVHNIQSTDPKENLIFHKILDFFHSHAVTIQDPPFFHKILDFFHSHAVTIQDPPFENELDDAYPYKQGGFFLSICYLLKKNVVNARNYLIKKHIQDVLETWMQATSDKPGALHGVAGGTSDQTIYTFANVGESHVNRLRLGINEGYPIANPVLQVAPGFYGYYKNGAIESVFADFEPAISVEDKERGYIARNNTEDEYIYDEINAFSVAKLGAQRQNPSNGLLLLQTIWDFEKHLKDAGRTFYYDMSRINNVSLHPMIVGDLYTKNQQYRHALGERKNATQAISQEQFMRALYPIGDLSEERMYHYKNLSRLHMRKKIEEDFGLDLSKYDLFTQRAFLEFLETRDIENVENLQVFVSKFGGTGLKTFLSLEYGREFGDDLIAMGDKLPQPVAQRIFSKYSEIIEAVEGAGEYLSNNFQDTALVDPAVVANVQENLLRRGRDLLATFSAVVASAPEVCDEATCVLIERELELIRADAALFVASFREMSVLGEMPDLEQIKDVQFEGEVDGRDLSQADVVRMKELYRINYAQYPEFQKMLLERFDLVLGDPGNRFYIFRYKGVIEGYYRLGATAVDTAYFGAFNMNPKYRGSGIGEALMQKSLDVVAKDSVIEASCTATEAIASNYIERGFVGTSAEQVHEIYSMDIVRNDKQRELFRSKSLSVENLKAECTSGTAPFICQSVSLSELNSSVFAPLNGKQGDRRNVLTRYIRDKKAGTALLVFEQVSESTLDQFLKPEHPFRFVE